MKNPLLSVKTHRTKADETTAKLFPDSFENSERGKIPKDWSVQSGIDVANVGIGKTPPRKEKHWFSLDPRDMKSLSIRDNASELLFSVAPRLPEAA